MIEREDDAARAFVIDETKAPAAEAPTEQAAGEALPAPVGEAERPVREVDHVAAFEALLFVAEGPLSAKRVAEAIGVDQSRVASLADDLNARYEAGGHAVRARVIAGGFSIATSPDYAEIIRRLYPGPSKPKLTRAALETLAIVAYKQPIVRAELDAIRGVNCAGVVATLLERDLIAVVGRADGVGRPLLYATTPRFLEVFGLPALTDLPKLTELAELLGEGRDPAQTRLFDDED